MTNSTLALAFMIVAAVLFALDAWGGLPEAWKGRPGSLGLLFMALSFICGGIH